MSKMGKVIFDIQSLAGQGVPNKEIAKFTKTSIDFVDSVVEEYFNDAYDKFFDEPDENTG